VLPVHKSSTPGDQLGAGGAWWGSVNGGAQILSDFTVEAGGFVPGGEHVHDHCAPR